MVMFRVAVSRSKDVPPFGPNIPAGAKFGKQKAFADFLLTKGKEILFHDFVHLSEDCLLRVIRDGAVVRAFTSHQCELGLSFGVNTVHGLRLLLVLFLSLGCLSLGMSVSVFQIRIQSGKCFQLVGD